MLAQVDQWYVWMVIDIYTAQQLHSTIIIITKLWMMLINYSVPASAHSTAQSHTCYVNSCV